MDRALINDIDRFIKENKKNILRDIARLVEVNSVEGTPAEGAPYGAGPRKALDVALAISEELGLNAVNCEDVIGYAELGKGDEYLATVTHVDVVPVGDGWKSDPFKMREKEGFIIGRGVLDDKGPAVICLYALKYLLESGTELKYPIRALLGTCEETGMQDVVYYLENYPAPVFAFSPDADFPVCNGEKGITQGRIVSAVSPENVLEISGGFAHNAIPDSATALVIAGELSDTDKVHAEKQGEYWKLTATGLGGHASLPAGTDNAIGNLVSYLLDNGIPSDNERPYFEAISLLHAATDGSRINCAASDDVFEPLTIIGGVIGIEDGRFVQTYDSRYPTSTNGETIRDNMQAAMGDVVSVIMGHDTVPFYVPLDNPAVQVCINAYNDVTGENAKPFTIGGGTYARDFPNAVSFGPEHHDRPQPDFVGHIHGVDEGASVEYLLEALKIYIVALINLEKLDF